MEGSRNINELAQSTGLSTRTLRTYLANGILRGDKCDGAWSFTPEQVEAFVTDKAVEPSIRAKRHALVYDFLGQKPAGDRKVCMILDLPLSETEIAKEMLCAEIKQMDPHGAFRFGAGTDSKGGRIILTGSVEDVLPLVNRCLETSEA